MNDKISKFVLHKLVKLDNFNRPVRQSALVLPIRLINMKAGFSEGQNNTVGVGSSLTTVTLRYCGSIRSSGKR
jgi:hypothetical protein